MARAVREGKAWSDHCLRACVPCIEKKTESCDHKQCAKCTSKNCQHDCHTRPAPS